MSSGMNTISLFSFPTIARALGVVIPCSLFKFTLNILMAVVVSSHTSTAEQYGLKNCLQIWLPDLFWLPKKVDQYFSGALLFSLLEIGVQNPCSSFAIMLLLNTCWPV